MKKIYVLIGLMLLSAVMFGQGIQFEKGNVEAALKKAKAEKKMLFIDAYAVWCGPCKMMAKTVFLDEEVGKYFDEHVVAMKIDVERGEGPRVKKMYGIEGLPGYAFIDADGNVVYRSQGRMPKEKFLAEVKQAYSYMQDPNSVGRLAARHPAEKNNEQFLALYLQKLAETRSAGHVEVLEQYLSIQKSIRPESREMAKLLDDHYKSLIYGGKADAIIAKYSKTDEWRGYVRKAVRERFLELPQTMAQQTSDYAVKMRDSSYIDVAIRRAKECGMAVADNQRRFLMIYFYKNTGMGEEFKTSMYPDIEMFYQNTNVEDLYAKHMNTRKQYANQPEVNYRTHAMKAAAQFQALLTDYGTFVVTDTEKASMLRWAKMVYDLAPDESEGVSFYARVLYLFGDKTLALKLQSEALRLAAGTKGAEAIEKDYRLMQENKAVML